MSKVTFAELQALATDTRDLPPMGRPDWARKHDAKRGQDAKRQTRARRQARALKREAVLA